jgi:molybdopterin converting factor subunit 1
VNVEVLLFAAARQAAGCDKVTVQLAGGSSSVADLKREIAAVCPALESVVASSMIAINHEYVRDNSVVPPNAEIALIPPVSGG